MTTATKATWTPVWFVHQDGERLIAYEASDTGGPTVQIRQPGAASSQRWRRENYERQYAPTKREACQKFLRTVERGLADIQAELRDAQALVLRAERLLEAHTDPMVALLGADLAQPRTQE